MYICMAFESLGLHWFCGHKCTQHNAHRIITINFLDRRTKKHQEYMKPMRGCIGWLRLVISIPSHKIKWRWLIGWLWCPCSNHYWRQRRKHMRKKNGRSQTSVDHCIALPAGRSFIRVVEQIFYCYLICHLNHLIAGHFYCKHKPWWLVIN